MKDFFIRQMLPKTRSGKNAQCIKSLLTGKDLAIFSTIEEERIS
jgi:hypothetical protein